YGLREQVRRAVPVDLFPARVAERQPLHRGITLERGGEIPRHAVDPSRQDVAAARLRRDRRERRPARIPARRSIRKRHRHLFHLGPPARPSPASVPGKIQAPPPAWDGGNRGSTHLPPSPGGTRRAISGAPGRHEDRPRLRSGLRPGTRAGLSAYAPASLPAAADLLIPVTARLNNSSTCAATSIDYSTAGIQRIGRAPTRIKGCVYGSCQSGGDPYGETRKTLERRGPGPRDNRLPRGRAPLFAGRPRGVGRSNERHVRVGEIGRRGHARQPGELEWRNLVS